MNVDGRAVEEEAAQAGDLCMDVDALTMGMSRYDGEGGRLHETPPWWRVDIVSNIRQAVCCGWSCARACTLWEKGGESVCICVPSGTHTNLMMMMMHYVTHPMSKLRVKQLI